MMNVIISNPCTWEGRVCKESKYTYPAAGHVVTGNLKIISDSRIRSIICKGPKYRFLSRIDFKTCREVIAAALNDFSNRWCNREYVECLKELEIKHNSKLLINALNFILKILTF